MYEVKQEPTSALSCFLLRGCIYTQCPWPDFLFAVTGNRFQADEATGRVIGVVGEIQTKAKQMRVTPGTSEVRACQESPFHLCFSRVLTPFSQLLLVGEGGSHPYSHYQGRQIVLCQQLSEKPLGKDSGLASITHPPLVQSPVD